MLKRYFIAIFLLSAVSLNGMNDSDDSDQITVFPWPQCNKIEAKIWRLWRPGLCTHSVTTVVIKDRNSDSFEVCAELHPSAEYGIPLILMTAEPHTVEMLKAKIAEYEQQMK